jgi:hypothetical protein
MLQILSIRLAPRPKGNSHTAPAMCAQLNTWLVRLSCASVGAAATTADASTAEHHDHFCDTAHFAHNLGLPTWDLELWLPRTNWDDKDRQGTGMPALAPRGSVDLGPRLCRHSSASPNLTMTSTLLSLPGQSWPCAGLAHSRYR